MSLVSSSSVGWRSIPWSAAWDVTGIVDHKPQPGRIALAFLYYLPFIYILLLSLSICILLFLSAQFSNFKYCTQNVSYNNRAVMLFKCKRFVQSATCLPLSQLVSSTVLCAVLAAFCIYGLSPCINSIWFYPSTKNTLITVKYK